MPASNLTPASDLLADRIRLHRQQSPGCAVVIVEGSPDKRLLQRLFPLTDAVVFPAGPRKTAIAVAKSLAANSLDPYLCAIDRDFDSTVVEQVDAGLNVLAYDNADLEAMLWTTEAFEDWLLETGSQSKIEKLGGTDALRSTIEKTIEPLQRLRAANAAAGWGLDFTSVDLRKRVKKDSLELSVQGLCDSLWRPERAADKKQLFEAAEDHPLPTCPETGSPLFRGKDAVAVAGVALRRVAGNLSHIAADPNSLANGLRLAANSNHLASSPWYERMRAFMEA